MKVTVAISCYNQEDKITACMESVMAQDYDDIEILIVDDHSTDRSVEGINRMIESHPERTIRLLVHDTNKGITEVRNNSIREASGDSIFFVDGDDTMVENTLGLFCQQMEKKGADVVCGSFRTIDGNGQIIRLYKYPADDLTGSFAFSKYIEKHLIDKKWVPVSIWNKLYRLEWLRSNNIYCSTDYKFHEDMLFTFKVAVYAKSFIALDEISYNWVQYPTSVTHNLSIPSNFSDLLKCRDSVFVFYSNWSDKLEHRSVPKGIRYLLSFICLTNGTMRKILLSNMPVNDKKTYIKKIRTMYKEYDIHWHQVAGAYNKISYLIMMSPFPYPLFLWYFRHLRSIVKIVNNCR